MDCKGWAVQGSNPPLCSSHAKLTEGAGAPPGNQNRRVHGIYGKHLSAEEVAELVTHAANMTLDDEVALVRITLSRVNEFLSSGRVEAEDIAELARVTFAGARTVGQLLRHKRAISGAAADGLLGAISAALDELSTELGVEI